MKISNISLKAKILGLSLGIVVTFGVGSFINMYQFSNSYRASMENRIKNTAVEIGRKVGAQFYDRYHDVQAFAINSYVRRLDRENLPWVLDQYINQYKVYDLVLVIDSNGFLVSSNTKDSFGNSISKDALKKIDFSSQKWFQAAMNGEFTEDKEKDFKGTFVEDFINDTVAAAALGDPRYGSSFTTPISNEAGQIIGVITTRAGKRWFESEITEAFDDLHKDGFSQLEVTMINKEDKVISFTSLSEDSKEIHHEGSADIILNENFAAHHDPAGPLYHKQNTGVVRSRYKNEPFNDVVAFHKIDNTRFLSSLGWGIFVHDSEDDVFASVTSSSHVFLIILFVNLLLAVSAAVFFGIYLSKEMNPIIEALSANSLSVSDAAIEISRGADELAESSTKQAAALQETVAAVDEINAMVERNAESAENSKSVSAQSKSAAERGHEKMEEMMVAIQEIDQSNHQISKQMEQSNNQLSDITRMINEIENKTKVINEIVFQTKLLSFNASVEAARAGEYGKGFAVVAEEIGNLAHMSGSAAKEITTLLASSVNKVNSIVEESSNRVQSLIKISSDKVRSGTNVAKECTSALNEIIDRVKSVDSLISEIAVASNEQSTGISEISKAVGQMDEVTQKNSAVANQTSESVHKIRSESDHLNQVVQNLITIINGKGGQSVNPSSKQKVTPSKNPKEDLAKGEVLTFKGSSNKDSLFVGLPDEGKSQNFAQVSGSDVVPSGDDPGFAE